MCTFSSAGDSTFTKTAPSVHVQYRRRFLGFARNDRRRVDARSRPGMTKDGAGREKDGTGREMDGQSESGTGAIETKRNGKACFIGSFY